MDIVVIFILQLLELSVRQHFLFFLILELISNTSQLIHKLFILFFKLLTLSSFIFQISLHIIELNSDITQIGEIAYLLSQFLILLFQDRNVFSPTFTVFQLSLELIDLVLKMLCLGCIIQLIITKLMVQLVYLSFVFIYFSL